MVQLRRTLTLVAWLLLILVMVVPEFGWWLVPLVFVLLTLVLLF